MDAVLASSYSVGQVFTIGVWYGAQEAKDGISASKRMSGIIPAVATLDSSHIGSLLFVLFKESLKMDSPRLRELSPAVRGSQDAQDA